MCLCNPSIKIPWCGVGNCTIPDDINRKLDRIKIYDLYPNKTFYELYNSDKITLSAIDDYIDKWHESDTNLSICDFLGLTGEQYAEWVRSGKL